MKDILQLHITDFESMVLTGIYSEETLLPQPLRISVYVDMEIEDRFSSGTPLTASKNYMDIKKAVSTDLQTGGHYTLVESVADQICETMLIQDNRITRVAVKIVKVAIAEAGESIGITLVRHRHRADSLAEQAVDAVRGSVRLPG